MSKSGSRRRSAGRAAALAVAAFAGVWSATASRAGDGQALKPPLKGLERHTDDANRVSVLLPEHWTAEAPLAIDGFVAGWGVWVDDSNPEIPHFRVAAVRKSGFRRAGLCGQFDAAARFGTLVDGTVVQRAGFWEERRDIAEEQKTLLWRLSEHDGVVWAFFAQMHPGSWQGLHRHAEFLLDSFEVMESPAASVDIPGCKRSESEGRELVTDVKSRVEITRALKAHAAISARVDEALAGEAFVTEPPTLVLLNDAAVFAALATAAAPPGEEPATYAFEDPVRMAAVAHVVGGSKAKRYLAELETAAALQGVRRHFGGSVSTWIEEGLARYVVAVEANKGDAADLPELPRALWTDAVLRRAGRFADLQVVRARNADETEVMGNEGAAWHWFFRHAAEAQPYRATYLRQLALLRESGQPRTAADVWDAADLDALQAAFEGWIKAWRP